jgi:thiol-disulfide isomerase/thioredoxin
MLLELSLRPTIAFLLVLTAVSIAGCDRQSPSQEQANATAPANAAAPEMTGVLDTSHKGEAAPATPFQDPSGKIVTIASFKGRPLLLNLWATWCVPCIREMPTLDTLAQQGGRLQVVAVSQDMKGAEKVRPFFNQHRFKALKPYLDPDLGLSLGFGANLPTTILYDAEGKEVWRYAGGLDWTSDTAKAMLAQAG